MADCFLHGKMHLRSFFGNPQSVDPIPSSLKVWLHQLEAAEGDAIFTELPSVLRSEVAWAALHQAFK